MGEEILLVKDRFLLEKYPGKGGWTYTILPESVRTKRTPFGWVQVKGYIDDFEIKSYRLMPLSSGKLFLPVRAEIRKKIKKKEGDWINVTLYADNAPVEIPEELLLCFNDNPQAHQIYISYTASEQKAFTDWIYSAKKEATRVERIAKTLDMLEKKQKLPK